jgi:hypothetical protein
MKQLERLLFLQGNRCFFCQQPIPVGEASVEHLAATSNGGAKDDENCVACCKTVNAALGNLSIKAKLQAVINQRGIFVCPHSGEARAAPESDHPSPPVDERFELVVSDLQKRGPSRPRKLPTLRNTVNAVFQNKLSEEEVSSLVARLESHGYVTVQETKVTYALPQPGA